MIEPKPGNYLDQVIAIAKELGLIVAGNVASVTIYHDDDCPILKGGECACIPDIKFEGSK